jgi:antitoxin MazE
MEIENDAIVLRRPKHKAREGWAEASKALAESGDDALVMGEFPNADDADLTW